MNIIDLGKKCMLFRLNMIKLELCMRGGDGLVTLTILIQLGDHAYINNSNTIIYLNTDQLLL